MEALNNRHHRYTSTSTSGITILRMVDNTFNDNPLPLFEKLVKAYNNEITNEKLNKETLEAFYKLLCCEYQYKFKYEPKLKQNNLSQGLSIEKILKYIRKTVDDIPNEKLLIIFDIIILQIAIYSTAEQIIDLLKELSHDNNGKIINNDIELLTIIDCITEAKYLNSLIYEKCELINNNETEIYQYLLNQITSCLFRIENPTWKLFISILSRVLVIFDQNTVVTHLWNVIFNQIYNDYEKKLILISCIIDTLFELTDDQIIKLNILYCVKDEFWLFILHGIVSNIEQQRKQSLYLMKRVLEFLEQNREIPMQKNMAPFIYCQCADHRNNLKQTMIKFFLILESLEEKQAHFVTPVLVHLKSLMLANFQHQTCRHCFHCFDNIWLRCVFQRILQHKTNIVMKLGLIYLMKMNSTVFDEAFLSLLVKSLNNTTLYDNKSMKSLPEIAKDLAGFLIKAEYLKVNLINGFIHTVAGVTWAPIPLFYIFESLKITSSQLNRAKYNIWSERELEAVITIIEKNLNIQNPPMREDIQANICRLFYCCAQQPLNLNILAKTFSTFPSLKIMNRGSESWDLITKYLENNIEKKNAVEFICQACDKLCINECENEINLKSLALIIVLLYDAKRIFVTKPCRAQKSLYKVFDLIRGADVRSYIDTTLCLRTIELIESLLNVLLTPLEPISTEKKGDFINHLIFPYLDSAQRFIFKSLKKTSSPTTYKEAKIYVKSFHAIGAFNCFIHKSFNFTNDMKMFQDETIRIIDKLNGIISIRYWYNIQILHTASMYIMGSNVQDETYINFLLKMCQLQIRIEDKSDIENSGKMICECYEVIGKLLKPFFVSFADYSPINFEDWLLAFQHLLDNGKEYVIASVIGTMCELFDGVNEQLPLKNDIYESLIDISWRNIWDLKKNQYFWSSIDQFIALMLQSNFLNRKELTPIIIKHIDEILTKSENIPNLKNVLIQQFREIKPSDFLHFHNQLITCLVHANIGGIDKRIEMQMCDYLMKQHEIFDLYQYTVISSKNCGMYVDVLFRAECILLLLRMMSSLGPHYFTINTILFFTSILEKLKNKRYHGDSNIHRIKHRVLQLLLLIQPLLDMSTTMVLYDAICDLIVSENDQPSVRIMQEWLLIRMFIKYPTLRDNIWDLLEIAKDKRPGSITSVASIIYHVSQKLPIDKKVQYIRIAIRKLTSCCFSQTFVVRLYCQVILSKLFDTIQTLWSLSLDYTIIRDAVHESLRHGNWKKNSIKLFQSFYFYIFDPIQDYDLQTIFYELPRLLKMSPDELIPADVFSEIRPECDSESEDLFNAYHISIQNKRGLLSALPTPDTYNTYSEIKLNIEDDCGNDMSDIQKKIMPWNSMLPIDKESTTFRRKKLSNDAGLIVVASLIDSIPNLGGLSRTSEIFCAKELVLDNIKCVEYKEFQSLSVSSEKWIAISEVKIHALRNYLLEKKNNGWTLVGVEQTANSVSLLDMKFDKKTILLLGNEKSGIPANLIPLMDVCVEIPQAGVVRSLNVHVTGAICMWDYCKQHIF